MHWPQAFANINETPNPRGPGPNGEPGQGHYILDDKTTFNETWADMEKCLVTGKVKAIGGSAQVCKFLNRLSEKHAPERW